MNRQKRIEFLAATLAVFVSAFVIYACVGYVGQEETLQTVESMNLTITPLSPTSSGLLAGLSFSAVAGAVILFARYIAAKSLRFKVLAAALWPLTVLCIGLMMFFCLPYQVYNLVKIICKA